MQIFALQRITAFMTDGGFWLLQTKTQQENGEHGGNNRHPEYGVKIVGPEKHQQHSQQRAEKGANGIQRLTQPVGGAADLRWGDVGDQRVSRRAANAFAYAVYHAGAKHHAGGRGDGKQRLAERAQAVAQQRQPFALADVVADRAGEDFQDQGGGFRQPLDKTDNDHAGAEGGGHKQR